jgi:hypothetical protein
LREHGDWLQGCEERLRQHELLQRGTQGEQAELRQHETWMQHQRSVFERHKETVRRQFQSDHRARWWYARRHSGRKQPAPAPSTAIPVAVVEPNRGAAGDAPLNRAAQTEAETARRTAIWDHYQSEHRLSKAEAAEKAAIVAQDDENQTYLDSKAKYLQYGPEYPEDQSAETLEHIIRRGKLQEAAKAARAATTAAATAEWDARGKWLDGTDKPTRAACAQYHEGQLEKAARQIEQLRQGHTWHGRKHHVFSWELRQSPLQPQHAYQLVDEDRDDIGDYVGDPIMGCYIRAQPEGHRYDLSGETGGGIPTRPRGVNSPPLKSGASSGGAA